ncbi:MAG: MFS transporter, partial [Erysipelotrichaceae bacterium]|nr:MFS transporter [Erysipelotrichaceae bacterium]
LASTIYGIISGFFAPLLVKCLRKYPLKYILLLSGLLTALLSCSFGFMYDVKIYLLANVFKGFLNAFFNSTVIIIIIGNWFKDLKSTITALVLGFSGIAGAFFSPLFSSIIGTYGLKAGYFTQAFFQFVLVLPAFFLLTLTPEEQNMTPYENALKKQENTVKSEDITYHPFSVKDPVFIATCVVSITTAILFQISNHFNGYAQTLGAASIGPLMVSSIMIGNIFFKFAAGTVCDRFGNKNGVIFLCVFGIIGCTVLMLSNGNALSLLAGAFLMGAVYANQVTTPAMIRYVYGDKQYPDVYAAQSVPYGLMYLGNMIFGYIYDFTGSYKPCFIFGIAIMIIALLAHRYLVAVRQKETGNA